MSNRGFKAVKPKADVVQAEEVAPAAFKQTPSRQLLKPSFRLLRQHATDIIIILVLPSLLLLLGSELSDGGMATTIDAWVLLGTLLLLAAFVWLFMNLAVTYYFMVRLVHGERPELIDCYRKGLRFLPRLLGLAVLTGLLAAGGLVLFIVPGLIVIRRYILAPYFLVDEDLGIREAMQRSAAASRPVSMSIWSTLMMMLILAAATAGLGQLFQPYGAVAGVFLSCSYLLLLPLRYREVALRKSAASLV